MSRLLRAHGEAKEGGSKADGSSTVETVPIDLGRKSKNSVSRAASVGELLRAMARQKHAEQTEWRWEEDEEDRLMEELWRLETEEAGAEGRQTRWYGDELTEQEKGEDVLRLMAQNQDKMGGQAEAKGGKQTQRPIRGREEQWRV